MSSVVTLYGMKELPEDSQSDMKVDWLDPKQNIGIEIEVEFTPETITNADACNMWTVKADGSLRRGTEFVLSRPLRGDALSAAIEEFFAHNQVHRSATSGTHIHVDMRNKEATLDVAKTMASIIACIEPAIFGMFADGREWCGYTNPLTTLPESAAFSLFSEKADSDTFRSVFSPNTREYKYYGFNMLPLGRYGSVEFRYFNTAETAEELIEWVQFCMAVKAAAVKVNTRSNFKYFISSEMCWEEFLTKYFAQWRDRMLPLLPFDDVSRRYKLARQRGRGLIPKQKLVVKSVPSDNSLIDTRFKKFFAVKVKNEETGRGRLVYDINGLMAATPFRVFIRHDQAMNDYPQTVVFTGMDFLVTEDVLFKYSVEHRQWMEYIYYVSSPPHMVESYRTLTPTEALGFVRAATARSAVGRTPLPGCQDLNAPGYSGWRVKMAGVARLVEAMIADTQQTAQEEDTVQTYTPSEPDMQDSETPAPESW